MDDPTRRLVGGVSVCDSCGGEKRHYDGCLYLESQPPDLVNHPPHYTGHPSGVECITITRHMGFNLGNAVKYIWRADLKGNALEDLKKAQWYIADEIERLTNG